MTIPNPTTGNHTLGALAALTLLLVGCDAISKIPVKDATAPKSKATFEKKKQCAEVGWQYFQRKRSELEREFGQSTDMVNGPYFAYNVGQIARA